MEQIVGNILGITKLKITAAGLKGTMRKANDGVTYFGIKSNKLKNKIDYELNLEGNFKDSTHSLIFMIYFRKDEQKFYIKSSSKDSSMSLPVVQIQITQPYVSSHYKPISTSNQKLS